MLSGLAAPQGHKGQRYSALWLEWMSQALSVMSWLEEYVRHTSGNNCQKRLASRRGKCLPEGVRTGIRDGLIHLDALAATAEWLTVQCLRPLVDAQPDETYIL